MAEQTTPKSSYIGLARRYRSQQFSDLVGQDQIAHSLSQQVMQNRVAQAYLFSGPRGVGKTSSARILAKSLNCVEGPTTTPCGKCDQCLSTSAGNSMDVIEIDGASNRSIDDIRSLQETISQNPFSARKKVYIIDEVHMLTREAFNALLKTLEEPPPFVIFILATTELEKIPETIKSRCQVFQFNRISMEDLIRRLDYISTQEGIEIDPGERHAIFETIALAVDGGLRDAVMALDQLRALGDGSIRFDETVRFLGVVEHDLLIRTVELLQKRETKALLELVNYLVERGRDLERYIKNLLSFLRDLMILKSGGGKELVNLTGDKMERAKALLWAPDESGRKADALSYPTLLNFIQVFLALEEQIKEAVQVRIHLEFAFVKLTAIEPVVDIAELLERTSRLGGTGAAPQAAIPAPKLAPAKSVEAPPPPPRPATPDFMPTPAASTAAVPPAQQPAAPAPKAPAKPKIDPGNAAAVWDAVMAHREKLGMGVSFALRECRCLGMTAEQIKIGISRKSLSLPVLQAPDKRAAIEKLIREVTGHSLRVVIEPLDDVAGGGSGSSGSGSSKSVSAGNSDSDGPDLFSAAMMGGSRLEPVLRDSSSEDEDDFAGGASEMDTRALYLAQNPEARVRAMLQKDERLRKQVDMIVRFFDGRLTDLSGRAIAL